MGAFKLVNFDGSIKFGIAASTYDELIRKVREYFGIPDSEEITVVVGKDGTQIVDDEYLETLPHDSVIILLKQGEDWQDSKYRLCEVAIDQTDASQSALHLLALLAENPGRLTLLDEIQLEMICDYDVDEVDGSRHDMYEYLQGVCYDLLAHKRNVNDANALLKTLREVINEMKK